MRPKVILHNSVSLDGRVSGFEVDLSSHYAIAEAFKPDAVMVGSKTLKQLEAKHALDSGPFKYKAHPTNRPKLLVIDRYWRLSCWKWWANQPDYYSEVLVAVHPQSDGYKRFLDDVEVPWVEFRHFKDYFEKLYAMGHRTVQVDSGGELNHALLSRRLVDEISLLIHPEIVGRGYTALLSGGLSAKGIKLDPLKTPEIHELEEHPVRRQRNDPS